MEERYNILEGDKERSDDKEILWRDTEEEWNGWNNDNVLKGWLLWHVGQMGEK